jgi:hypothetical protein
MPWIGVGFAVWWAGLTAWQIFQYVVMIAMVLIAIIQATLRDKSPAIGVKPGGPLDQSNTFGFDNFVNNIGKENPLSIIYGEYKHAGNRFYTEISGSHNNNNVTETCIGIGEGTIDSLVDPENNLKLNDTPWKDITSPIKSYTLHTGTANQTVDDRILESSITVDNNTTVPENDGEIVITGTQPTTTYIRLGLQCPYGLYKVTPYAQTAFITYSWYYRLYGSSTWILTNPTFVVNSTNNKFEFSEYNYVPYSPYYPFDTLPEHYWPHAVDYLGDVKNYYPPELTITATVADGVYTPIPFAAALQTAMNAAGGGSTYTVTWNNTTNTLSVSSNRVGGDGKFIILANGYQYNINGLPMTCKMQLRMIF